MAQRIQRCETQLFEWEGSMFRLNEQVKRMEDRQNTGSVELGDKVFKDQKSVEAWCKIVPGDALYQYSIDMVTFIELTQDPYESVSEGLQAEAAAFKAKYESLLEGRMSVSYQLTYPDNVMKRTDKADSARTEGWAWTGPWATYQGFRGDYNNGTYNNMKRALTSVRDMTQNAIDFAFPVSQQPVPHGVFTHQCRKSYEQAVGWLESLTPLYENLTAGGLNSKEAWNRVLVYTKALFEDIKTVRTVAMTKSTSGMIWGSFLTGRLLEEYLRLRFLRHPNTMYVLAQAMMVREGKAFDDALSKAGVDAKAVKDHTTQIGNIQKDIKDLKAKNSLK